MTSKQSARFAVAKSKLPPGYSYRIHDQSDAGFHDQAPYGVALSFEGPTGHAEELGYVGREVVPGRATRISGSATGVREDLQLQQLLLNRAAAALWHRQPRWER